MEYKDYRVVNALIKQIGCLDYTDRSCKIKLLLPFKSAVTV